MFHHLSRSSCLKTVVRVPPSHLVQIHFQLLQSHQEWDRRSNLSLGSDSGLERWVSSPQHFSLPLGPVLAAAVDADCRAVIVAVAVVPVDL